MRFSGLSSSSSSSLDALVRLRREELEVEEATLPLLCSHRGSECPGSPDGILDFGIDVPGCPPSSLEISFSLLEPPVV